jgi:hypothetical protein
VFAAFCRPPRPSKTEDEGGEPMEERSSFGSTLTRTSDTAFTEMSTPSRAG